MDDIDIEKLRNKFLRTFRTNHPDEVLDALASALSIVASSLNVRGSKIDIWDAVEALRRAAGTYEDYHETDDNEDDEEEDFDD
jgi:hypothetical protein